MSGLYRELSMSSRPTPARHGLSIVLGLWMVKILLADIDIHPGANTILILRGVYRVALVRRRQVALVKRGQLARKISGLYRELRGTNLGWHVHSRIVGQLQAAGSMHYSLHCWPLLAQIFCSSQPSQKPSILKSSDQQWGFRVPKWTSSVLT